MVHIGSTLRGYDDVHGGFYFGDRNEGVIAQRLLTLSFLTRVFRRGTLGDLP